MKKSNAFKVALIALAMGLVGLSGCNNTLIPNSVTEIATGAFRDCRALTLKVPSGSYAEQYAKDNAIPYTVV